MARWSKRWASGVYRALTVVHPYAGAPKARGPEAQPHVSLTWEPGGKAPLSARSRVYPPVPGTFGPERPRHAAPRWRGGGAGTQRKHLSLLRQQTRARRAESSFTWRPTHLGRQRRAGPGLGTRSDYGEVGGVGPKLQRGPALVPGSSTSKPRQTSAEASKGYKTARKPLPPGLDVPLLSHEGCP
ncbi:hypothetical protein H920_12849 [Fukomys damarensis]|uniref:Uncharacterized protein n=1 Tax=Fukomys damarensis TaxID=885580 RepID=A0A091D5I2_FUKDA|nr:hypothetical protein H920_12849 [Fukomys damarensis]